ncbi:hypothetical protein N7523_008487 [Penicillium sp. IBT 18751x]|nr:hypothetical protein N7523_008487 [Penicillium sp. IBT 18751x]
MLQFSSVVAIAASGAAIFVVLSVVGIVVWVRVRKERHAIRLHGLKSGQYAHSIHTFTGNTLTELSHEEGNVLGTHGQLPYGKPGEWGQLTSRESLIRKNTSNFPLVQKARSLRHSLSRSRSRRLSRFSKHSRLSSMATVDESVIEQPVSPPRISRDDVPLSAVEGVLELPTERTPRQTPEINQDGVGFHLGMRPVSPGWPFPSQKERSGLGPLLEGRTSQDLYDPPRRIFKESPQRIRGNSICGQSAGLAPDDPIPPPPPPAAFPVDRMSYARNDSVMRLSSMSLDTTNSSILDDGRNGLRSVDTDLTSPDAPSGGTFVPFSASDVGKKDGRRSFISASTSIAMPPLQSFPARSSSTAEARRKSSLEWMAPRRSVTTTSRNPSNSSHRLSGPPCRSDSLSSNAPTRNTSFRSGTPGSLKGFQMINPINWRSSGSQSAYIPHFSQFQQPPVYENEPQNDPFYGGSPQSTGTLFSIGSPGQTATSSMPPSPMQRSSLSQRGPTSALKSAKSQRKGHRRQNCVRISIHPPMTFAGPTFSPTVEEEQEDIDQMEEVDLRESNMNGKSLPILPANGSSPLPLSKRSSRRNKAQPSTLGPLAEEPQSQMNKSPSKKKKIATSDAVTRDPVTSKTRELPGLVTSLPPVADGTLDHTPSPSRTTPVWELPEAPLPSYETTPGTGSPRRSGVKGPRSQPQTPRSTRSNPARTPTKASRDPFVGSRLAGGLPLITGTQGSDWRKSTDSLHHVATDADDRSLRRSPELPSPLVGGLGPLPASPRYGIKTNKSNSTVRDRVTIWEDANRGGSPPKPSAAHLAGRYAFSDNNSPTHSKSNTPRSLCKNGSPTRLNGQRMAPTPASARRGTTTPIGKGVGLGVVAATPVSLYDGEGFFRE